MSVPSAYQVQQAMACAASFAAALRQEIGEDDHDRLLMALDSETDAIDLLRRVVRASLDADAQADAADARIKDLTSRRDRFRARKEAARGLAFAMLDALGLPRLDDPEFTISVGKPRPKVIVTDLDALPEAFVRVTRSPDMATINAAIKAGQMPAGVEVANGAPSLTIRTK
jgi:hypothetical protein